MELKSKTYSVNKIVERKNRGLETKHPRDLAYISVSEESGIEVLSGDKNFLQDLESEGLQLKCNEAANGKYEIREIVGEPVDTHFLVGDHVHQLRILQDLGEDY